MKKAQLHHLLYFLALLSPATAAEPVFLFDGTSLEAWTDKTGERAPGEGWVIADGLLHRKGSGGDILTKATFSDFILEWGWKIAEGGNSGVKYWVNDLKGQNLGLEYQLIDDQRHADAKKGGNRQTAAIYDIEPAATDKAVKEAGEWNQSKLIVRGGVIEHWLNGSLAAKMDTQSEAWKAQLSASKYAKHEGFAPGHGHILLQDHGDQVWFKDIRITDLSEAP